MSNPNDAIRPFIKALIEAHEVLSRGTSEVERLHQSLAVPRKQTSFWQRLFGRSSQRCEESDIERLSATATGLRMGQRRLEQLMGDAGLEPIASLGQVFDPETMEAVGTGESTDAPPNTVIEELRLGYRWNGRVVRFAQVRVAK